MLLWCNEARDGPYDIPCCTSVVCCHVQEWVFVSVLPMVHTANEWMNERNLGKDPDIFWTSVRRTNRSWVPRGTTDKWKSQRKKTTITITNDHHQHQRSTINAFLFLVINPHQSNNHCSLWCFNLCQRSIPLLEHYQQSKQFRKPFDNDSTTFLSRCCDSVVFGTIRPYYYGLFVDGSLVSGLCTCHAPIDNFY